MCPVEEEAVPGKKRKKEMIMKKEMEKITRKKKKEKTKPRNKQRYQVRKYHGNRYMRARTTRLTKT